MKFSFKKFKETIIEGLLLISSSVTSLTVILIVVFLFKEGISVVNDTPVEENHVLVVHNRNTINHLTAEQIKDIFDGKIVNWLELGGRNLPIAPYSFDELLEKYSEEEMGEEMEHVAELFNEEIKSNEGIIVFALQYFYNPFGTGKKVFVDDITVSSLFFGSQWYPTSKPAAMMGFWPLILGTLLVSFVAILFALPFALAASIYLAELANKKVRAFMKPTIELLAGIPSVVYGFFGLVVVVPFVKDLFNIPVGETAFAGSIVLAIMALPTIITIAEDSLRTTPRAMREASLALGANKWQTILRVTIPYSISGISAAIILGIGRAIGETMAILMVSGNAAVIPNSLLIPVRTIPATIAAELGEAPFGGLHFKALFALGCILFVITMTINFLVEVLSPKRRVSK